MEGFSQVYMSAEPLHSSALSALKDAVGVNEHAEACVCGSNTQGIPQGLALWQPISCRLQASS